MLLEPLGDLVELRVRLWHVPLHLRDLRRRADAGDDVLALGVRQVFAVELLRAGVRVTSERDARPRVVAHVSVDHRDDAAGGPEVVRDLELLAIVLRALPEPRAEHGLDRQTQLLLRLGREWLSRFLTDDPLVFGDELFQLLRRELGVGLDPRRLLPRFERLIELRGVDVKHDAAEHRDESPVRVPGEALVLGELREARAALVVQAEVEDRVHHSGHAHRRTRADRDEQRILGIAELLLRGALDRRERLFHLVPKTCRQLFLRREVGVACGGGDRETGRNGKTGVRHLREPRALATQEIAHLRVAFGFGIREQVDPFLRLRSGAAGCRWAGAATNGHGGPPLRRYRFSQKRVDRRTGAERRGPSPTARGGTRGRSRRRPPRSRRPRLRARS